MTAPKKIINSASNSVSELIEGLLYTFPTTLQKLENHNVVLANPVPSDKVCLISGGGSGHGEFWNIDNEVMTVKEKHIFAFIIYLNC